MKLPTGVLVVSVIVLCLSAVIVLNWSTTGANTNQAVRVSVPGNVLMHSPTGLETSAWSLTAVGDIMLDRYVRTILNRRDPLFPFSTIDQYLMGDLVVGNLEGPFTTAESVATDTHLVFTFDPALAPVLHAAGFTDLSLANNHTLNFGQRGLDNTRQVLAEASLHAFGDPRNAPGYSVTETVGGQPVALIGYHGLSGGLEKVVSEVRQADAAGMFVVVMAHWGNEYQLGVTNRQRDDAHALVEAGADLIIGAHPHVVEPFEIYQQKFIAYSLGNFLFDQFFSDETVHGLLLQFSVAANRISVRLLPTLITSSQILPLDSPAREQLLDRLADNSFVPESLRQSIRDGMLSLSP